MQRGPVKASLDVQNLRRERRVNALGRPGAWRGMEGMRAKGRPGASGGLDIQQLQEGPDCGWPAFLREEGLRT